MEGNLCHSQVDFQITNISLISKILKRSFGLFSHNLFNLMDREYLFLSARGLPSVCSSFPVELNLRKLKTTVSIVLKVIDVQAYFSLNGQTILLILLDKNKKISPKGTAKGVLAIPYFKLPR